MRYARLWMLVLILSPASQTAPAADKPLNFVVLLVDDWGWTDAGCYGSDFYETPHIDRLAADGVQFTNAYAACTVCSPTRAALLTGMYPGRTRVTDWIPGHFGREKEKYPLMPPDWTQRLEHRYTTLAEALQASGYRTAHVGKWHLTPSSDDPAVVAPFYPDRHGFEVNIAGNQFGAPASYFWPFERPNAAGLSKRTANFPPGGKTGDYLTDTLTDHTLRLIEEYREEPFCLYFPYYNVHTPLQGKPELVAKYEAKRTPGLRHSNATYAAMVQSVDESVGRIRARLEELKLADRTVILLTSDNGGLDLRDNGPTKNAPLRSGKGSAYEGGVRVPLLILWPGVTPAGAICDTPAITVDYYPTILELAGVAGDPEHNRHVDGKSLVPVLRDPGADLGRTDLFWHYPHYHPGGAEPYSAIRSGDWRLVEFQFENRVELYNLGEDLGERRDLSASNPEKVQELRTRLNAWRQTVGAQAALPNPDYRPSE